MFDPQRITVNVSLSLILLLYLQAAIFEAKETDKCPIGFQLAFTTTGEPICYSLKSHPEKFSDKFENCIGNLFTWSLYNNLNLPKDGMKKIWTDYKSLYPGGPFIDWSYTSSTGIILETTYEVTRDFTQGNDEELCVVVDPFSNFTASLCDEHHYRYCFLKPYDVENPSNEDCGDLTNGIRFWGPVPYCLTFVVGKGATDKERTSIRANIEQATKKCENLGGALLGRGWRYSNYWTLTDKMERTHRMYPLDMVVNEQKVLWWRENKYYDSEKIPEEQWNFEDNNVTETSGICPAISGDYWYLVNRSTVFFSVLCEKPVEIKYINLTVTIQSDDLITLRVNDTISIDDILCFTDSTRYFPQRVTVKQSSIDPYVYTLKAIESGYYWCTHRANATYAMTTSNSELFVKVKESTQNLYAVKVKAYNRYELDIIGTLLKVWKNMLEDYVFYSNEYTKSHNYSISNYNDYTIMNFSHVHPERREKEGEIIKKLKLKRLYLDAQTALLHVQLHPDMKPASRGQWRDIVIEYMKPVYFCDKNLDFTLGMNRSMNDCKVFKCVGDYNVGVQTVITSQDGCYTPAVTMRSAVVVSDVTANVTPLMPTVPGPTVTATPTVTPTPTPQDTSTIEIWFRDMSGSDSSEEFNETTVDPTTTEKDSGYNVTTISNEVLTATTPYRPPKPPVVIVPTEPPLITPTTLPPNLDQVIMDLETLLNGTEPVMVSDIEDTFDQVNNLLEEEVEITSNLLHLLDKLGSRIDLNGSADATTVRESIALIVADSEPNQPLRGLRIAQRNVDSFYEEAFQVLRDEINSTHLTSSDSEVVVQLPESVSTANRRVSFVVFRDDHPFHRDGVYAVNSRVLSVNIENTTTFTHNEVIDIHLKPIAETVERNQSRACAYWHFEEDGSARWSQDGCVFIPAADGFLDTCRCDHLTHFAEILVPRTVFSEGNETALEIITVVGCCVSIVALLLVGLTAALFRSWRRDYSNKVWLQLCASIFILSVIFLIVVFARFESGAFCTVVGVALHYTVLASFCWMLVAAVLSYRRLVTVFTRDASHKLLRAAAFAWGAPCAVIAVLLSVNPRAYEAPYEELAPSGAFCYPSGLALWLAVYAPIAVMLLANWTLFILIVRSVFASRRIQRHGDRNEALRCASVSCLLVFLFGLPWIFGLFSFNVVAAYFFTILATFQGLVLFLFFVLGNKKTRDLWLNKLKIKQTRKIPVTSSTYTNRSTGAAANSTRANPTPATIEANVSKPKSLSSSDNGRFS